MCGLCLAFPMGNVRRHFLYYGLFQTEHMPLERSQQFHCFVVCVLQLVELSSDCTSI